MTMGNAKPSSCALVSAPSFRGAKLTRSKHASQPFSWRAAALLAYSYTLQKRGKLAKVPSVLHNSHTSGLAYMYACTYMFTKHGRPDAGAEVIFFLGIRLPGGRHDGVVHTTDEPTTTSQVSQPTVERAPVFGQKLFA